MSEKKFPSNIAIIMDGNGRWAQKRDLPISHGHKAGAESLAKILEYCKKIGVNSLTVYAFSTENWKRSVEEIGYIMNLLRIYIKKFFSEKNTKDIRIKFIGNFKKVDPDIIEGIKKIEEQTKNNIGLNFDIAFCYGGRLEIIDACKKIIEDTKNNILSIENLSENNFRNYLYDDKINDPDLIIRTGGDYRISNFLLWEMSYSELYFTDTLWPDFDEKALDEAINNFEQRKRTYGERKAKR